MRDCIGADDAADDTAQHLRRIACEERMDHNAIGRGEAECDELPCRNRQGPARGRYIVHKHGLAIEQGSGVGDCDPHVSVARAFLLADEEGGIRTGRNLRDPLFAFFVRADNDRPRDVFSYPPCYQRCGMNDPVRYAIDLAQSMVAVQMRVDRHQPVEMAREDRGKAARGHRLARVEADVLAHIGEIGRDKADPPRTEFA